MPKTYQVYCTDNEAEIIERDAQAAGLTVSQYLKKKALSETEFQRYFDDLLVRVANLPNGTTFTIREVFSTDWTRISKGVRLALGRAFFHRVGADGTTNVRAKGKDSANTQMYYKGK